MGAVIPWPTREPGRPYRWLLDLTLEQAAPTCPAHREKTDGLGICPACVYAWRESLGVVPAPWTYCRVCQFPIHPAAEGEGVDTCPTCDEEFALPERSSAS